MTKKKSKNKVDIKTLPSAGMLRNRNIRLAPLRRTLYKSEYMHKKIRLKSKRNPDPISPVTTKTQEYDKNSLKPSADQTTIKRKILDTVTSSKEKVTPWISRQVDIVRGLSKSITYRFSQNNHLVNRKTYLIIITLIPASFVLGLSLSGLLRSMQIENRYGLIVQCASDDSKTIKAQDSINKTFFIKNNNKKPVILNIIINNWDPPEAQHCIEISWDYDESPIPPGETCKVIMIIKNQSNIEIDDYTFDIDFTSQNA